MGLYRGVGLDFTGCQSFMVLGWGCHYGFLELFQKWCLLLVGSCGNEQSLRLVDVLWGIHCSHRFPQAFASRSCRLSGFTETSLNPT